MTNTRTIFLVFLFLFLGCYYAPENIVKYNQEITKGSSDKTSPKIILTNPTTELVEMNGNSQTIVIKGFIYSVKQITSVTIGDNKISLAEDNSFVKEVIIYPGNNNYEIAASDLSGNTNRKLISITGIRKIAQQRFHEIEEDEDIDNWNFETRVVNKDAIAVVIGNRDYRKIKNVDFAMHDAEIIIKYLISTFGYKEGNIFLLENASKTDFELYFGNQDSYKGKLFNAVKEGKSDVFIYYSGHGAPGLKDKKGYFVPAEADPQYLELSGYSADVLYENLSKIPARSITVVMDACFSGATVYDNISPMALETSRPIIKNAVVLSSSEGTQPSSWYNEKKHGLFTYFFLKGIHNKNADSNKDGNLTFDELYQYISDKSEGVPYHARRVHGVEQDPTIEGQYQGKVLVTY
jgi:hypothetical protein